jgi:predicted RNase H-like nuclease (RuvC/YqgF family)
MRGKHGASAETRHKIRTVEASIESYQHAVRRLTAENQALKQAVKNRDIAHAREVKRLKAERDEGLSPTVAVLQAENKRAVERADKAKRALIELKKLNESNIKRLHEHFFEVHGMSGHQALEEVVRLIPGSENALLVTGALETYGRLPLEAVERIQRARGLRR